MIINHITKPFRLLLFCIKIHYNKYKHKNRTIPMTWFTSDLHYGHNNVIGYCNRPFYSTHQMNKAITAYWNSIVKPFDNIYVLGDFSINPKHHPKYVPYLSGIKHLIVGNHDHALQFGKGSQGKRDKVNELLNQYWCMYPEGLLTLSNGVVVKMHHMPYRSNFTKEIDDRYWHKRPEDNGHFLLCGHQHARYIKSKNMIDVGFDGGLKFYSEKDIINLINDKRDYIPSRITEYYKNRKSDENKTNY